LKNFTEKNLRGPGSHELKLFFDNYMARRSVVVTAISILSPASADLDGSGCPDGLENLAQEDSSVSLGNVVESHVSPAFIEGRSRSAALFELRTRHEGPASALRQADEAWSIGAAMFQAVSGQQNPTMQRGRDGPMMGHHVIHHRPIRIHHRQIRPRGPHPLH
jgi:hypothetical protein